MQALDAVIEAHCAHMVQGGLPGAFVFVEEEDGSSIFRSAGFADLKTGRRPGELDHYRIGSTTKTFTAVTTLQLVAEAALRLDDHVVEWLPEFVSRCDPELTVEHLLRMRSGLFDFEDDPSLLGDLDAHLVPHDLDEILELSFRGPKQFSPGERSEYCNSNFCVLERIIERATDRTLGEELAARIFRPLGLRATSYPDPDDLSLPEPFIHGYQREGTGWRDCSEEFFGRGDGAIVSTTRDVARFLRAVFGGELVPEPILTAMRTIVEDDPPPKYRYGMGLIADVLPDLTVWGHSGGGFGYRHWPFLDPSTGRLVICMVNGTSGFRTTDAADLPQFTPADRSSLYRADARPQPMRSQR